MQSTPAIDNVNGSSAKSLFKSCVEQVDTGDYFVTAMELAITVLNVVHEIANGDDYNCDQVSEKIGYATHFFKAFNREVAKQKNHDFMYMLADQVDDMIEDENLQGIP